MHLKDLCNEQCMNKLTMHRQLGITWTHDELVHWSIYASVSHNDWSVIVTRPRGIKQNLIDDYLCESRQD